MNRFSARNSLKQSLWTLTGFALAALLVWQVLWGGVQALSRLNFAVGNSAVTFDDDFRMSLRISSHLIRFVQDTTPEHATLLLGPGSVRTHSLFFFYPRKLLFGGEQTLREHPEIDYVVVRNGFPDFPVLGERIMLDDENGLIKAQK